MFRASEQNAATDKTMVEVEAALMTADVLTGFVVYTQEHERMHGWARCSLVSRHHEGRMAIMSQNVIRPSTMGTVGGGDSVVNSRVGHLPDDDGLACRSRRAMCKQEVLACRSRRLICKQDVEMEERADVVERRWN